LTIYLRSQGKAALPPLAHALRDPNEFIRMRAIAWLGLLGPDAKDLAEEIREAMHHRRGLAKTSEQKYLSEAVQTLAALGLTSKEYVRDLAKLLDDRDPCVQRLAARTIGSLGAEAKAALPALQQLPDSVDPLVLIAATEARMRIDGDADRATQILDHILADASQKLEVRAEAVAALCRMGPKAKAAMATFATLARSTSATERTWAASAYLDIAGAKQTAISLCIVTFDHGQCEPEAFRLLARMQHSGIDIRAAIPAIIERGNELGIRKTDLPFDGDARKFFEQVLGKSSARGSAPEDWRQFWMNDQPSHLTPEHLHGGIGP
jgi:HEAT repeat protein